MSDPATFPLPSRPRVVGYAGSKRAPGPFATRAAEVAAKVLAEAELDPAITPEQAQILGREIATNLCWEFSCERPYIPADPAFGGLTRRDREIWAAFTGDNYAEIGRATGLSLRMVRYVINHCRRVNKATSQPELPGFEPDPLIAQLNPTTEGPTHEQQD